MKNGIQRIKTRVEIFRYRYRDFVQIYRRYRHYQELMRLSAWARRKRLYGPYQAYKKKHEAIEMWLGHQRLVHPAMSFLVPWLHSFQVAINPRPKYYKKGSAKRYSIHSLSRKAA